MSGVKVLRHILGANAALTAVVPNARIYMGTAPLNLAAPYITVTKISGVPHNTVAMTESGRMQSERDQVSVVAATAVLRLSTMALVRTALANQRGTIISVSVDAIIPDGEGPDLDDEAAQLYQGSIDMIVRWHLP